MQKAIYRFIRRFANKFNALQSNATSIYFKWAIAYSYSHHHENVCRIAAATNLGLAYHLHVISLKNEFQEKEKGT